MRRRRSRRQVKASWPLFAFALAPLIAVSAQAATLPTGGRVVAGSATIGAPAGGSLTIDQTSKDAIINWSGFSIGIGNSVTFDNGSGATLNRVTGSGVSSLNGVLNATGSVFVINANGIVVGRTGVVRTGGSFVASTLDLANPTFTSGTNLTFAGTSRASVVNLGKIGSLGGDVTLIAATVRNGGAITATHGDAALVAGYRVLLRDRILNDGKFAVLLGGTTTSATNAGVIKAADAELRAHGGNIYALAGNTGGIIDATGVKAGDGHVWLVASGGSLNVDGSISAQGINGAAGTIETSASNVGIGAAAIDAHGGTWTIDPVNLAINGVAAQAISNALATSDVTEETTATGFTDGSGKGTTSPGAGDITLDTGANIAWTSGHALTFSAFNNLNLKGSISLAGGTLNLAAGDAIAVSAPISVSGAGAVNITATAPTITTPGGDHPNLQLSFAPGASVNFGPTDNGGTLTINGAPYKLFYSLADFVLVEGVPDMALATSFTAPTTAHSGPILALPGEFTFEGLGNSITGVKLTNAPGGFFVSLSGVIRDLSLIGGSVSGGTIGNANEGFIADQNSGLIANVSVSGSVAGGSTRVVGDLVGDNTGTILDASASGQVTGNTVNMGGLAGTNEGTIQDSSASGAVSPSQSSNLGGLVGKNTGTIEGSSASGTVTGQAGVMGGLVGLNDGTITASSASGVVDVEGDVSNAGGLVGVNGDAITTSSASGAVNGGGATVF